MHTSIFAFFFPDMWIFYKWVGKGQIEELSRTLRNNKDGSDEKSIIDEGCLTMLETKYARLKEKKQ